MNSHSTTLSPQRSQGRYAKAFSDHQQQGGKAFIPFTLLGWPSATLSKEIVQTMIRAGATALELGIPFSDPVADGPVIQTAAQEALAQGFQVDDAMALLQEIRLMDEQIPIGLLVYYNVILARGVDRFFSDLSNAGVDGILIPDLPPESAGEVFPVAQRHGIELIFIASPLTSTERLGLMTQYAGGFLYIVSRLGITGVEERYDDTLESLLENLKTQTSLPLCVGFGISKPEHAQRMFSLGADGVIVGSHILQRIREGLKGDPSGKAALRDLYNYLVQMRDACQQES
jgi:tryptophan synthase alpha chain